MFTTSRLNVNTKGSFMHSPFVYSFLARSAIYAGLGLCALLSSSAPSSAQTLIVGTYSASGSGASGAATVDSTGTSTSGTVTFPSGTGPSTTTYKSASVYNTSTLTIGAGGSITSIVFDNNQSAVNVNGGSVHTLYTYDQSTATLNSGSVNLLYSLGSGVDNVYGGSLNILEANATGSTDIFGTGLTETYQGSSGGFNDYLLTGTLQDNTPLNARYATQGGTLLFNGTPATPSSAPEPSQSAALGVAALGIAGLVLKARRRKTAA